MYKPHIKIIKNNIVFIDVKWYKRQGIVVCQDLYDDRFKFYIGLEEIHFSDTEKEDILGIMGWGSTFPEDAGKVLFKEIDFETYSYKDLFPEELI